MCPVWVMQAFRLPVIVAMSALALSGCMHRSGPVATVQPQSDLDTLAYGQPLDSEASAPDRRGRFASAGNPGGLVGAINARFARSRAAYGETPLVLPPDLEVADVRSAESDASAYQQTASAPRRGLFTSGHWPSRAYAPAPAIYAEPAPVIYAEPAPVAVAYAAAPIPVAYDTAYKLDAGDKLRIVVYGQEGLTNTYAIGASGAITMPLIGSIPARGRTPAGLASEITAKLRNGFIRDPSVAVEVESYRPFFILGEVAAPGQYPYVPNLSVESAVAIAGGFSPRARRDVVTLTHTDGSGLVRTAVPMGTPVSPGDTVLVGERWF
jgi:polysaccharide export outer membrane protein